MATAEAAPASVGPRYAPEDPTLPQPWKGLIDGSTGVLYYWNPETNITQYERPTAPHPPLPAGPPRTSTTPKLAQLPVGQGQQAQPEQFKPRGQVGAQHGPQVSDRLAAQDQGSVLVHGVQQPQQYSSQHVRPQMLQQHPGQHAPQQQGQQFLQQPHGHPSQLQTFQPMPQQQVMQNQHSQPSQQQVMQNQHSQVSQQQSHQYMHSQQQYMGYQPYVGPQGLQTSYQAPHAGAQDQQFPSKQEYNSGAPKREEEEFHTGKQTRFSQPHLQNVAVSSSQNIPFQASSAQMPRKDANLGQAQQHNGPPANMHSVGQFQHNQLGPSAQNHIDPKLLHQKPPGSDSYFNARIEGPVRGPHQPHPATMPKDVRIGGGPPPNAAIGHPGAMDPAIGRSVPGTYGNTPPAFPNNPLSRPQFLGPPDLSHLSPIEAYLQQHEVTTTGENIPAPFISFEVTGFPPELLREFHTAGFSSPTPIQAQTWPIALQSRDIVAIAKTGSGKTLGYLIPAFMLLRHCRNDSRNGPTVLVLAPTRELATQIQEEALRFGRSSRVSCTCLYGGAPKGPQLKELERGADIVVATPGRLNDILEMKKIDFQQVSLFVLDEADRMLDMGFEPQIRRIVNEIPPRRQTLMYTATWPKEVRKIAEDLLVNSVQVNIGRVDELAANKAITQYVEVVPQIEKERRLEQILRGQERGSKVIIFCATKRLCDHLGRSVGRNFGAVVIHGDKSQGERDWVLNQFRSGKSCVLIATDVAARGLDIKDIRVVINYDFPTGVEDYVHRIGRTGRAGATGIAYTFFTEQDWKHAPDLIKVLEGANQQVPPQIREIAMRGSGGGGVGGGGVGSGFVRDRGGGVGVGVGGMVSRFDSGGGSRWDSAGPGREGGFGGQFSGGYGGRGGGGGGGMRNGSFGRDGNRGRGYPGPGAGNVNGGRGGHGRFGNNNMDGRGRGGRGFGRGGGRFDNRRGPMDRSRGGRTHSRSPELVRTWGRSRSRSRSRSYSRSRSRSYSRSRSRSWSRSRSRSPRRSRDRGRNRSRSRSYSRSRSRSLSYERPRDRPARVSGFDVKPPAETTPVPPASVDTHGNGVGEEGKI